MLPNQLLCWLGNWWLWRTKFSPRQRRCHCPDDVAGVKVKTTDQSNSDHSCHPRSTLLGGERNPADAQCLAAGVGRGSEMRSGIGRNGELLRHLTPPALGFFRGRNSPTNVLGDALQLWCESPTSVRMEITCWLARAIPLQWSIAKMAGSCTDSEQFLANWVLPSTTGEMV